MEFADERALRKRQAKRKGKGRFFTVCDSQTQRHKNNLQKHEKEFEAMSKSANLNRPWDIETLK